MAERADDAELVEVPRQQRQVFADVDARHVGGDRLEFAANLVRGVRFHVEGVVVGRPAVEKDDEAGLGFAERRRPAGFVGAARAWSKPGRLKPNRPRPPTCIISLRVKPWQVRTAGP